MQTMTTTTTPATPTPTASQTRGFPGLRCPICGQEAMIRVDLSNIAPDDGMTCEECSESFGTDHVREFITRWTPCLLWLDAAPVIE